MSTQNQVQTTREEFVLDELVFAKQRGYGLWPSKIIKIERNWIKVLFLGYYESV